MQTYTMIILFFALIELRGLAEILEVEKVDKMVDKVDKMEEKMDKVVEKVEKKNPSQEWDYYGEEVANDERKRRQALGGDSGQEEVKEENSRKKRDGRKSSAIRINNQDMTEIKNKTEPLLVEDPPGIGLGHILGITTTLLTNINYKIDFRHCIKLEW